LNLVRPATGLPEASTTGGAQHAAGLAFIPLLGETAMPTYSEKLRDPRWQKTRLEILTRDEWTCQICFDTQTTLNVHHRYYDAGADPWDYPPTALITLCQPCHEFEEKYKREAETAFIKSMRRAGAFNVQLECLADIFEAEQLSTYDWDIFTDYLAALLPNRHKTPAWRKIMDDVRRSWLEKCNKAA
jgi:hypothetical protein